MKWEIKQARLQIATGEVLNERLHADLEEGWEPFQVTSEMWSELEVASGPADFGSRVRILGTEFLVWMKRPKK